MVMNSNVLLACKRPVMRANRAKIVCASVPPRSASRSPIPGRSFPPQNDDPFGSFFKKVQMAWEIFFPPQPKELTAKDEVKRRLRMVLVADRCGLSPGALAEMKVEIVDAIRKYVDIKGDEEIEVNVSMDPELGTVYSVNIPVKRVKAVVKQSRTGNKGDIEVEWTEENWDADPSNRFPMGA